MNKNYFFFAMFLLGTLFSFAQQTVNIDMNPGYSQRVFFGFKDGQINAYPAMDWDLAFLRINDMAKAIRINGGKGIKLYQASDTLSKWGEVKISDKASWTELFNSEEKWTEGAFDRGTAQYGWGVYDIGDHHVKGTIIFVVELPGSKYIKIKIDDYFRTYKFTYSKWDASTSAWGADITRTLSNSDNQDKLFNYFSFETDDMVNNVSPPYNDWDIVFCKYIGKLSNNALYNVTGVLQSVPVAEGADNVSSLGSLSFSEEINTIGHDWKDFSGSSYVVNQDKYYYIKTTGTSNELKYYKMHFLTFEGGATGKLSFEYEDVTDLLSIAEFEAGKAITVYPNPSTDGRFNIGLDSMNNAVLNVYSINGQHVHHTVLSSDTQLDLSHLANGTYLFQFASEGKTVTKKIILAK